MSTHGDRERSDAAPARGGKRVLKVVLAFAFTLGLCLLAEAVVRGVAFLRGAPYDANNTQVELRSIASELNDFLPDPDRARATGPLEAGALVVHPYLGFDVFNKLASTAEEAAYFQTEAADSNYDIVILGGSVAAMFGNRTGDHLCELLRADPRFANRPIKLFRHGRGAYKEPQQLLLFGYLLSLGYRPDAVITIDGFNEVALAAENAEMDVHPLYPAMAQWATVAQGGRIDREALDDLVVMREAQLSSARIADRAIALSLHESAILGPFVLGLAHREQAKSGAARLAYVDRLAAQSAERVLAGPSFDAQGAVRASVRAWVECTRSLADLCADRSIFYLHVLQPTLHDSGSKPLQAIEVEKGTAPKSWIEGVHEGYPLLRAGGRELASHGVKFFDASMVFRDVQQKLYYDACHFVPAGERILARSIATEFLRSMP